MAAQVSNDDGKPVLFSGMPCEADQQHTQLNGVLTGLIMTAATEVRRRGRPAISASTGTVFHALVDSPMRSNKSAGAFGMARPRGR